jgi:hypothetical protein
VAEAPARAAPSAGTVERKERRLKADGDSDFGFMKEEVGGFKWRILAISPVASNLILIKI